MDDWVVDSLVGFLQSPLWTNPVDDFIEHLFYQQEESEKLYYEVYSEYQSMVEQLLASFTEDLGIKAEQLTDACVKSGNLREKHRKLLQPLLASEDFELFKVTMHQKKLGLEQKALQLQLEQSPSPFQPDIEGYQIYKDLQTARMEKEERMLQEALEQSQKEYDQEREKEDQEMEKLMKLAKQESLKFQAMLMETANDQMELLKMAQEESLKMFQEMNERAETGRMSEFEGRKSNETNRSDVVQEDEELQNSIATTVTLSPPRDEPPEYNQKEEQTNLIPLGEWSGEWSEARVAKVWEQNAKSELNIATPSDMAVLMQDLDPAREKYRHQQRDRLLGNKTIQAEDIQKVYSASPHKTHIVKGSNWQSETSGSCIKLPDKEKREGERAHKEIITKESTEGMEKCAPRIKSRTGVLCTVIARKLKENEMFQ